MQGTEIVRAELERLFELDDLKSFAKDLLGFDPEAVGGTLAKASFAGALTAYCQEHDALEALCDALLATHPEVDQRVSLFQSNGLSVDEPLKVGERFGEFTITRELGEGRLAFVYVAEREKKPYRLRVLRAEAARDKRGLHRFLTLNRLLAVAEHEGLPTGTVAGEVAGRYYVAHDFVDGQTLATRVARSGPLHINEARPLLKAVLEALSGLHSRRLAHGDLKLENVIARRAPDGTQRVTLLDAGSDRLRARPRTANGRTELFATAASPKTVAPEQIKGGLADARSDVYSFGALVYELVSGKSPFGELALDAAFGHLSRDPAPPSSVAPRGWVARDLDDFVLRLMNKDPEKRPANAMEILALLELVGRAASQPAAPMSAAEVDAMIEKLSAAPSDEGVAMQLETIAEGEIADRIAQAFSAAAEAAGELQTKKSLLFRAARIYAGRDETLPNAEAIYKSLLELDPGDRVALGGLESTRRRLGKFEELIEMFLERAEAAESKAESSRFMAEIGRIYATELDDRDQALVAYTQAFCDTPTASGLAAEIERLAASRQEAWNDVLTACAEASADESKSAEEKNALLLRAGRWYESKLSRPDLALPCFQAVVANDPGNDTALEALSQIYRKAQQWTELGMVLTRRADAAPTPARARELRSEAAELLELYLNDPNGARAMYEQILSEDPGQVRASDALCRLYERMKDYPSLVKILNNRADAQRGEDKVKTLCRIAEIYETQLGDDDEANKRYLAALEVDPRSLDALKGLDRLFSKGGRFTELLENLRRQIEVAATPRQKAALWERIAGIYEEEFLDHAQAAQALEQVLAIDPEHENAMVALIRHLRALDRWEDVVKIYERQIKLATEPPRKLALELSRAKVLSDQIGSPERAIQAYEAVLEIEPQHPGALEALARLRESAGDADAALAAILALAAKATTPEAKAEQYVRAAKLFESRGDKDRAIEHYKQALDANPRDASAAAALREAFAARGDVNAAIQLIEREIEQTEGLSAKAKLAGQMAMLYRKRLRDEKRAEDAAKKALDFDPTTLDALVVLGDIAFENKRFHEASKHYEGVAGRADLLEKSEAARLLVRYVDALSQSGSTEKALAPMDTLLRIAPDDVQALERVAQVTFENGSAERAAELYKDLLTRFDGALKGDARARAQYRYGEALRRSGDVQGALAVLEEAADLAPTSGEPLVALAAANEALERWEEVIRVKTRHLDIAQGDERVNLLVDIGEIASTKLNDRNTAAKSFVAALDERPDDRRLLTKLMQLYSEEKDWNKLVDVVLRLAEFVEDPKQRVKYLHTAAIVTARQIGDTPRAIEFYEQVLDLEPDFERAESELIQLLGDSGDHRGVERWLKRKAERATERDDQKAMLEAASALGELYENKLGLIDEAIDAYEAAQTLDPENRERAEKLSQLYATDAARYLDKAVQAQALLLRQNPYRHESYKTLRRLYTETKRADAAWCLCQALTILNLAEPDEERFYRRMRSDTAAPAQAVMGDDEWLNLVMHPSADPLLTAVFALIEPAVIAKRSQALEDLGYSASYAVDLPSHPAPVCQSIYYAAGVLGIGMPPAYENPNDPGGLSFLFARVPSLVLGATALRPDVPLQPAAFIAARQLTYLRPGMYLRHLLDSGTALKSWLFAAIKLTSPQFPVSPEVEGAVNEAMAALDVGIQGQARDHLTRVVAKLLQSGTALDLKRWVAGVDLTADRAGFIAAHDLETAVAVIRASDEGTSVVSQEERLTELVLFGVSEAYFELRRRLSIAVDS
jgi:tetratricopeptide (TPR) repeat protein/tRNA A-37 threonylcarbamoyl transferase component Bud32